MISYYRQHRAVSCGPVEAWKSLLVRREPAVSVTCQLGRWSIALLEKVTDSEKEKEASSFIFSVSSTSCRLQLSLLGLTFFSFFLVHKEIELSLCGHSSPTSQWKCLLWWITKKSKEEIMWLWPFTSPLGFMVYNSQIEASTVSFFVLMPSPTVHDEVRTLYRY